MIDQKDLRIGNLFYWSDPEMDEIKGKRTVGIVKASNIGDSEFMDAISLTEEWLNRMGFEKSERKTNFELKLHISAITLYCRQNSGHWYFELENIYLGDILRSVHQVQNFCAAFGKELEVKS